VLRPRPVAFGPLKSEAKEKVMVTLFTAGPLFLIDYRMFVVPTTAGLIRSYEGVQTELDSTCIMKPYLLNVLNLESERTCCVDHRILT